MGLSEQGSANRAGLHGVKPDLLPGKVHMQLQLPQIGGNAFSPPSRPSYACV